MTTLRQAALKTQHPVNYHMTDSQAPSGGE